MMGKNQIKIPKIPKNPKLKKLKIRNRLPLKIKNGQKSKMDKNLKQRKENHNQI